MCVSDPTSKQAAAAMDVRCGSFDDPDDLPGLSHFLEHMLFLGLWFTSAGETHPTPPMPAGSTKYPGEGEYNEYIRKHNGSDNAFTSPYSTTFYYSLNAEALEGALDRFVARRAVSLRLPSSSFRVFFVLLLLVQLCSVLRVAPVDS